MWRVMVVGVRGWSGVSVCVADGACASSTFRSSFSLLLGLLFDFEFDLAGSAVAGSDGCLPRGDLRGKGFLSDLELEMAGISSPDIDLVSDASTTSSVSIISQLLGLEIDFKFDSMVSVVAGTGCLPRDDLRVGDWFRLDLAGLSSSEMDLVSDALFTSLVLVLTIGLQLLGLELDIKFDLTGSAGVAGADGSLLRDDLRVAGLSGLDSNLGISSLEMDIVFGDASSTYRIASISLRLLGLELDFESDLAAAGVAGTGS
mmetsp:Transcript_7091/g.8797  ORF Transcript_7091/g.8797 Transcript_7091/m.8797 type:complete len:259 (+) Transcript_7091:3706-4482(+)